MKTRLIRTWQAQYGISGHCDACGQELNGRDTHKTHTVKVYRPAYLTDDNDYYDIEICDRHSNMSAALKQAEKRIYGYSTSDKD
jgi:hypothetical protein